VREEAEEDTAAATDDEEEAGEVCSMWAIDFQTLEDMDTLDPLL
jgi:hypothetical protein